MKFYLSSQKLGSKSQDLVRLMASNKKIGYIPNACDFTNADIERKKASNNRDINELSNLGLEVEILDLKKYFGKKEELAKKLDRLGGVFVRGGGVFILRQAMRLSGFDEAFKKLLGRDNFVYAGYSSGICVLGPDLRALQNADNVSDKPYKELQETVWEGLGYLDHMILPHYQSPDNPESARIEMDAKYCKKNKIPFKRLRDGEVIIIE